MIKDKIGKSLEYVESKIVFELFIGKKLLDERDTILAFMKTSQRGDIYD